MVNFQLSREADGYPFPDILTESSEGDAGLSNPVVDFRIDMNPFWECTTQVGEVVNYL